MKESNPLLCTQMVFRPWLSSPKDSANESTPNRSCHCPELSLAPASFLVCFMSLRFKTFSPPIYSICLHFTPQVLPLIGIFCLPFQDRQTLLKLCDISFLIGPTGFHKILPRSVPGDTSAMHPGWCNWHILWTFKRWSLVGGLRWLEASPLHLLRHPTCYHCSFFIWW